MSFSRFIPRWFWLLQSPCLVYRHCRDAVARLLRQVVEQRDIDLGLYDNEARGPFCCSGESVLVAWGFFPLGKRGRQWTMTLAMARIWHMMLLPTAGAGSGKLDLGTAVVPCHICAQLHCLSAAATQGRVMNSRPPRTTVERCSTA